MSNSAVSCIKAANAAHEMSCVEYSEPNLMRRFYRHQFIPTDPVFQNQWHLFSPVARPQLSQRAGISAPEAWDTTLGDRSIVVCVIDDGFDLTHPDFAGNNKVVGQLDVRPLGTDRLQAFSDVSPRAGSAHQPGDYHGCLLYTSPSPRDS